MLPTIAAYTMNLTLNCSTCWLMVTNDVVEGGIHRSKLTPEPSRPSWGAGVNSHETRQVTPGDTMDRVDT